MQTKIIQITRGIGQNLQEVLETSKKFMGNESGL